MYRVLYRASMATAGWTELRTGLTYRQADSLRNRLHDCGLIATVEME